MTYSKVWVLSPWTGASRGKPAYGGGMTTSAKPKKPQLNLEVVRRWDLSPGMVRVECTILNPQDYQDIEAPEKYVKLVFFSPTTLAATPEGQLPDYWQVRESAALDDLPVTRHMTLRSYDPHTATVWIDVARHGIQGYAGPWASRALPGDRIVALGPGGKWVPSPEATWTLLAGDDAALPAVLANLEALPATAQGEVILEVKDPTHQQDLSRVRIPHNMKVRWVHRATQVSGERALVSAVSEANWPQDVSGVQAFVHGEREAMKAIRQELFAVRGLARSQVSLSGYWAQGRTEELFQAEKKLPVGKIL